MAIFTGFKPTGLQKIANRLGYEGSLDNFENYLDQNPEKKRQMTVYEESAKQMARGGVVKMQTGGTPARQLPQSVVPAGSTGYNPETTIGEVSADRMQTPKVPEGGVTIPIGTQVTQDQMIGGDLGQVAGTVATPTTLAPTTTTLPQTEKTANVMTAQQSAPAVDSAL